MGFNLAFKGLNRNFETKMELIKTDVKICSLGKFSAEAENITKT